MDENLLLSLIENNAKMEVVDLAAALNETEENVDKTIKDLEKNKTIYGYHTLINWDKTNHDVCTAVIQVNAKPERDYGYGASFSTVSEAISSGLMELMLPSKGTPSTT